MNKLPETELLSLKNVIAISRGSEHKKLQYLNQFVNLVTERNIKLEEALKHEDRKNVRRILHSMRPQIQFFEIPEIVPQIARLELEYETIPIEELKSMTLNIIKKLKVVTQHIQNIIDTSNQ